MKHSIFYFVCLFFFAAGRFICSQETTDSFIPPNVLQPVPIEWSDDNRIWQGIPSMTIAPNGQLWACWYSGGTTEGGENYVLLASSNDKGKMWTKPLLAVDAPGIVRCFDPSMWTDPDGNVYLFWAQGAPKSGIWDGRSGVWYIKAENGNDKNTKWSKPVRVCDGIMMSKPIADSKGRYILPAAVWNIEPDHKDRVLEPGAHFVVSEDKGKTWKSFGKSTVPRKEALFDEHNIVEKKDGSFWLLQRTKNGMYDSVSTDGGKTWSEAKPAYPHTSSRFFVRRLKSGNLLFVKHGKIDEKTGRSHLQAFISEDDGKTWKGGLMLDERNNVSYPDGDQTADGTIYIIYDRERYKDKEILLARFTEEDVLAGEIVSPNSVLRLLVNKATGKK